MKKKTKDFWFSLPVRLFVAFVLEFSLASLIPLVIILFTPGFLLSWAFTSTVALTIALIFGCLLMLIWQFGRFDKACKILGLMTMFPGVLALIFTYYSPETLFVSLKQVSMGFGIIEPFFEEWMAIALPKAQLLMITYILFGSIFLWLGYHYQK